jgi:ribonuclease P protein component
VLPAPARLRRRQDFAEVLSRSSGAVRVAGGALVGHLHVAHGGQQAPQVGFVVSRAVGGAVTRNTVRRRLRHLAADRLAVLPPGSRLVLRALPTAAQRSSAALAQDLDAVLERALRRARRA